MVLLQDRLRNDEYVFHNSAPENPRLDTSVAIKPRQINTTLLKYVTYSLMHVYVTGFPITRLRKFWQKWAGLY